MERKHTNSSIYEKFKLQLSAGKWCSPSFGTHIVQSTTISLLQNYSEMLKCTTLKHKFKSTFRNKCGLSAKGIISRTVQTLLRLIFTCLDPSNILYGNRFANNEVSRKRCKSGFQANQKNSLTKELGSYNKDGTSA